MNRRTLLFAGLALALVGAPAAAQRFQPTRFSVEVVGRGPDVILIPGLTSGRAVWRGTVAALPGYRYHLIQASGFAGEPARGDRAGAVVAPLADEIARYIADRRLVRPAIVGHSMGGTLAMMIAARRPELAGRIMVVDMLPEPARAGRLVRRHRGRLGTAGRLSWEPGRPPPVRLLHDRVQPARIGQRPQRSRRRRPRRP